MSETLSQRLAGVRARVASAARRAGRSPEEITLVGITKGQPAARIAEAVATHQLHVPLLRDLLDAFSQDVVTKRYDDFAAVMDYCRRSANPIGRLLLHLFGSTDDRSLRESDAICSALQLINFWQDVAVDWQKGRVYIPREDLARFAVTEDAIAAGDSGGNWAQLMAFQCARSREMLLGGAPLGRRLPGRMGLEIRAVVAGGAAILDKIDAVRGDVFRHRPVLKRRDWARILVRAVTRQ